jgi:hypothetical protein
MRRNLTVPSHRPVGFADGPAHLPAVWISRRVLMTTHGDIKNKVAAGINPAAMRRW